MMRKLWLAFLRHWRRNEHPRIKHTRRQQRINTWRLR